MLVEIAIDVLKGVAIALVIEGVKEILNDERS